MDGKGRKLVHTLSYLITGVARMQDKMATDYKKFDRKYFIFATSIARSVSALNDSLLAIHGSADVDQHVKDLVISEVYMCCVVLCCASLTYCCGLACSWRLSIPLCLTWEDSRRNYSTFI